MAASADVGEQDGQGTASVADGGGTENLQPAALQDQTATTPRPWGLHFPDIWINISRGDGSAEVAEKLQEERKDAVAELAVRYFACTTASSSAGPQHEEPPVDEEVRLSTEDILVDPLEGGISNLLYKATNNKGGAAGKNAESSHANSCTAHTAVLIRLFGDSKTKKAMSVCERTTENQICYDLFAKADIGAGVLATFANGRIERFFTGSRALEPTEMLVGEISVQIAKKQAEFHQVAFDVSSRPAKNEASTKTTPKSEIWSKLHDWVEKARHAAASPKAQNRLDVEELSAELAFWETWFAKIDEENNDAASEQEKEKITTITPRTSSEKRLSDYNTARRFWSEVVFCHQDLLGGNVLVDEQNKTASTTTSADTTNTKEMKINKNSMRLIDFEYACWNHRGHDIANHFNAIPESMLIVANKFDPDEFFPSREHVKKYVASYLQELFKIKHGISKDETAEQAAVENAQPQMDSSSTSAVVEVLTSDSGLDALLEYCPLAELYWILWAVILSATSDVGFDYQNYAEMRWNAGYKKYKKEVLARRENLLEAAGSSNSKRPKSTFCAFGGGSCARAK
ncbi:unnamed protein product [Amoebophrya sp. A120]|nr:unnamed protein product [Amoebophrya sp. A120]CAD7962961.1 unnamed protein product [Amoebophrya sp. A120]|eukprot:GSA120T00023314001.1